MASTLRPSARRELHAQGSPTKDSFVRRNALALTCVAIFLVLVVGMLVSGHRSYNAEQVEHGDVVVSLWTYLGEGHFWEGLFENWESEFLQMAAYIALTALLIQRGSAESKDPDKRESVDEDPRNADQRKRVPWPVRRGGIWLVLYENSLVIAFTVLFIGSTVGHAFGGLAEHNADLRQHGEASMTLWNYVTGADFWYESLQNWQSEFLAVLSIVVLTIWLRQKGSPESKPVAAPHAATGSS
ncbi:MAG: DUF6766 family protein [Vicinamibacterales bacterium]